MSETTTNPTETLYTELTTAFQFFNERLFDGRLPTCLVTLQRTPGHMASLSANRFVANDFKRFASELSIHPGYFATQSLKMTLSNLVHEMVHLEVTVVDAENSTKTPGYHSRDWGRRMERVGLIPSESGLVGGKKTGFNMYHYVHENGPFDIAADDLLAQGWSLTWIDRVAEERDIVDTASKATPEVPPRQDSSSSLDDEPSTARDVARLRAAPSDAATISEMPGELNESSNTESGGTSEAEQVGSGRTTLKDFSRVRMVRKEVKGGKREKYVCNGCKCAVWGKPDLHVICGECNERMIKNVVQS